MKSSIRTIGVVLMLAPAAVFAQASNQPMTHAQAMDQLTQLRQDGYVPNKIHYPDKIQAAEARVAARNSTGMALSSGSGGVTSGTTQSGHQTITNNRWPSLYEHH
jgi:hypothetical protein